MDFEVHEHPTLAHSRGKYNECRAGGGFITNKALPRLLAQTAPAIIH